MNNDLGIIGGLEAENMALCGNGLALPSHREGDTRMKGIMDDAVSLGEDVAGGVEGNNSGDSILKDEGMNEEDGVVNGKDENESGIGEGGEEDGETDSGHDPGSGHNSPMHDASIVTRSEDSVGGTDGGVESGTRETTGSENRISEEEMRRETEEEARAYAEWEKKYGLPAYTEQDKDEWMEMQWKAFVKDQEEERRREDLSRAGMTEEEMRRYLEEANEWWEMYGDDRMLYAPDWEYFVQIQRQEGDQVHLFEMCDGMTSDISIPILALAKVFGRKSVGELTRLVRRLEKKHGMKFFAESMPKKVYYRRRIGLLESSKVRKNARGEWITVDGLLYLIAHFAKKNASENNARQTVLRYDGRDLDSKRNRERLESILLYEKEKEWEEGLDFRF